MKCRRGLLAAVVMGCAGWRSAVEAQTLDAGKAGVRPNLKEDSTPGIVQLIAKAKGMKSPTIVFAPGRYDFWPAKATQRHYFISNHDSPDMRAVVFAMDGMNGVTVDGGGATFVFHGLTMPFAFVNTTGATLKNVTIDYATPHILQATVARVDRSGVDVEIDPGTKYAVEGGHLYVVAEDFKETVRRSLEFDPQKEVAPGAKDNFKFERVTVTETGPQKLHFSALPEVPKVGDVLVLDHTDRPLPAIWFSESHAANVTHVTVESALGMAFLAQRTEDIHLDGFKVMLPPNSTRVITTNADAVHMSGCRGKIVVENGFYENMLDDGINVHGTYLRVQQKTDPNTMVIEWAHPQAFGFTFADAGDHVQFVHANTLLSFGEGVVKSAKELDPKHIELTFEAPIPAEVAPDDVLDNSDWYPTVVYRNNTVQHNRARGAIFKTPKEVLVEGNHFQHLSGSALLFASDANNWFESTPVSNLTVRNNTIVDPMMSSYGGAAIFVKLGIQPSLLKDRYNLTNIRIEDNHFDVFQRPLIGMTSVDGLVVRNNVVTLNHDFAAGPPNEPVFRVEHGKCIEIGPNQLPWPMDASTVSLKDTKLFAVAGMPGSTDAAELKKSCPTLAR
jgi:hypothetical protein